MKRLLWIVLLLLAGCHSPWRDSVSYAPATYKPVDQATLKYLHRAYEQGVFNRRFILIEGE